MSRYQRHFFVCGAERPPMGKPSCGGQRNSAALLLGLQEGLADHPELWDSVTVTACACLGICFEGPAMVVYPEGTWYANVRPEDLPEVVDSHLVGGVPVERLRYRWPEP